VGQQTEPARRWIEKLVRIEEKKGWEGGLVVQLKEGHIFNDRGLEIQQALKKGQRKGRSKAYFMAGVEEVKERGAR